jgi:hypothetical protein
MAKEPPQISFKGSPSFWDFVPDQMPGRDLLFEFFPVSMIGKIRIIQPEVRPESNKGRTDITKDGVNSRAGLRRQIELVNVEVALEVH